MTTDKKVAIVTGGNRGIGLAIVKGLAELGHTVLMGCRNVKQGRQLVEQLSKQNNKYQQIIVVELDLATPKYLLEQMSLISNRYPNVDILINNAAILTEGRFSELSRAQFSVSMQINALATFDHIQHFAKAMESNKYGRIVNVSSGWGAFSEGLTGPAAYSISKASLNAITKVAAQSYSDHVKINAMCPGWVRTRMGGSSATRSPEEAATTALWLANLDRQGPTGQFFRDKQQIEW
ncbi:SDR family NAD(P)-dependent oxidoreductase [Shewanella sp. 202IG2-18]|uniref:SDR family NAD(P)-dependent oxidoreductase n=1 Tax=Parashewanella hymeniacidonis TaxID=2807618 RepID=UPI001960F89B|nr:SDR family NAD(P)-dependent oxidoreductase [Parashewanella hymeniacidonis]MBM7074326.1 SDR family NAD(P)-dependent oxidoreductase [Parashewanella hymeniacidonis]